MSIFKKKQDEPVKLGEWQAFYKSNARAFLTDAPSPLFDVFVLYRNGDKFISENVAEDMAAEDADELIILLSELQIEHD